MLQRKKTGTPILIRRAGKYHEKHGGIVFDDCVVFDQHDRPVRRNKKVNEKAPSAYGNILPGTREARLDITPEARTALDLSSL